VFLLNYLLSVFYFPLDPPSLFLFYSFFLFFTNLPGEPKPLSLGSRSYAPSMTRLPWGW
jgi:hypothetical protein